MAYSKDNLRRFDYGAPLVQNAAPISYWSYATADAGAVVEAANYFTPARLQLAKGDVIVAHLALGGTPILKNYIVTSATGATAVTVAVQTVTTG